MATATAPAKAPKDRSSRQRSRAAELTALTGGKVLVEFSAGGVFDGDPTSCDRLFDVRSNLGGDGFEFTGIVIDGRRPLAKQLQSALLLAADQLRCLADQVCDGAMEKY